MKKKLSSFLCSWYVIWFINGFNNVDEWGFPQYLGGLDPMYPGLLLSVILAFFLKEKHTNGK